MPMQTSAGNCLYVEGASAVHPSSLAKVQPLFIFSISELFQFAYYIISVDQVTLDDHISKAIDFKIVWSSSPDSLKYSSYFSKPELVEFPTEVPGQNAYAYFYPPSNPKYQANQGEKPPLLLESHGMLS